MTMGQCNKMLEEMSFNALFQKLPVGIENFEKIRRDGFYYVDKTDMLAELLEDWGKRKN